MTSLLNMLSPSISISHRLFLIGHFRVLKTLTFKMSPSAQPFLWKWVLFAWDFISKAEHLTSFWCRDPGEKGNGLFQRRVAASSPCFSRPAARAPRRAYSQTSITIKEKHNETNKPPWNYGTAFTGILLITDFCLRLHSDTQTLSPATIIDYE